MLWWSKRPLSTMAGDALSFETAIVHPVVGPLTSNVA
jgi:hypothetical protein